MYKRTKLVQGVGLNDADYVTQIFETIDGKYKRVWVCPYYRKWTAMIDRCYSKSKNNPTYNNVNISQEFLIFYIFSEWMKTQDWVDKCLDKDLIGCGDIYSRETCIFLDEHINIFISTKRNKLSILPTGVTFDKRNQRYHGQCSCPITKKQTSTKTYDNPLDAHTAWKAKKHEHAVSLAMTQEPKIAEALRKRYV